MSREMKDSGIEWIGEIPLNWSTVSLGKIASLQTGNTPSMQGDEDYYKNGDILWVKPDNLNSFTPIIDTKEKINLKGISKARIVNANTPLVCCIGSIGKFGYSEQNVAYNQQINSVSFDKEKIYWKYGLYSLSSQENQHWYYSTGNVLSILNTQNQKKIIITIPSIKEQQTISKFLDEKISEIDNIIEKTKQSIELYKKYKQSTITEAVTEGLNPNIDMKSSGIDWIGRLPTHWDLRKIKYIYLIRKDIAGRKGFDILSVTQSGIKVKDITTNEGQIASDYSKYQMVDVGDFIMNHMDLLTGWVDYSKYYGVTSPDYRVFKFTNPELFLSQYYKYIMQTCYVNKIFYGLGQGVSNLGRWRLQTDKFNNFILPIPPKKEQKKISDYLDVKCYEIDNLINQKQQLLTELEAYKKSLVYECVTGKREV